MTTITNGAASTERRARIEAALAEYPHIDEQTLAELIHWFRKEASALEVGLIASDPRLAERYRLFKAAHLDRLRGADLLWAAVLVAILTVCMTALVWLAL
jgi:hypothetical protein